MSPRPFLHPFAPPTREAYLNIVRGRGSTVWDDSGKAYIDGMASLWYCNVGHGHPAVVGAIADQATRLSAYHCYAPFTNPPADALAEAIAERSPVPSPRVFFASSGSEAVDAAIKIARIAHEQAGQGQRDVIISQEAGYHGVTMGGTSAQGIAPNQVGFGPLVPDIRQVGQQDLSAFEAIFASEPDRIAAVIVEPVQCAGGVFPPKPGFLQGLRDLCTAHGAYLIFDEVVTGFGRLGTWFAADHFGVTPDLTTFAKAVTSGYVPLGGVICGPAVREALEADPSWLFRHGHTYSGHPLACAAGLACIEVTEQEGLLARAGVIGAQLGEGLAALQASGKLKATRGEGAVWAAVLPEGKEAPAVRDRLLGLGVIVRPIGDALAICPPLVIEDHEVARVLSALGTALS